MDRVAVYCPARGFIVEMVACYVVLFGRPSTNSNKKNPENH